MAVSFRPRADADLPSVPCEGEVTGSQAVWARKVQELQKSPHHTHFGESSAGVGTRSLPAHGAVCVPGAGSNWTADSAWWSCRDVSWGSAVGLGLLPDPCGRGQNPTPPAHLEGPGGHCVNVHAEGVAMAVLHGPRGRGSWCERLLVPGPPADTEHHRLSTRNTHEVLCCVCNSRASGVWSPFPKSRRTGRAWTPPCLPVTALAPSIT